MTSKVSMNIRLEDDPTKAQENDLLMKIYDAFKGSGTYLEMLFSPALVEFARLQILNDFSPQVDEYLTASSSEVEALKAELEITKVAASGFSKDVVEVKKELALARQAQEIIEGDNEHLKDRLQSANEAATAYASDVKELRGVAQEYQLEISRQKEELVKVKALLWDRENC